MCEPAVHRPSHDTELKQTEYHAEYSSRRLRAAQPPKPCGGSMGNFLMYCSCFAFQVVQKSMSEFASGVPQAGVQCTGRALHDGPGAPLSCGGGASRVRQLGVRSCGAPGLNIMRSQHVCQHGIGATFGYSRALSSAASYLLSKARTIPLARVQICGVACVCVRATSHAGWVGESSSGKL